MGDEKRNRDHKRRKKCCEHSREDGKEKGDKGRDLNRHERVSYTAEHEKKRETEARKRKTS